MHDEKDTPTEVYIVTCGSYSDYHIVSVFSTEADAKRLADKMEGSIETWPLNPAIIYPTMPRFRITLKRNTGEVVSWQVVEDMNKYTGKMYQPSSYRLWGWGKEDARDTHLLEVFCYAKDGDYAIKIAADIYAQVTAQNYWRFLEKTSPNYLSDTEITALLTKEAQALLQQDGQ